MVAKLIPSQLCSQVLDRPFSSSVQNIKLEPFDNFCPSRKHWKQYELIGCPSVQENMEDKIISPSFLSLK
jgi:hypothetical protein